MTGGFEQLERELGAAERRQHAGAQLAREEPRHRYWPRLDALVPTLGIVVALMIAGGAIVLLASSARHGKSRSSSTAAAEPASVEASARDFRRILAVLRRPQTAADLKSPLLSVPTRPGAPNGRLIRADARRATTARGGQGVYVIPIDTRGSYLQAKQGAAAVMLEGNGGETQFTVDQVKSGQASFGSYSAFPGRPRSPGPHQMFVLVPDGVARVTVKGRGVTAADHYASHVHGNVAIFYTPHAIYPPRQMRWYTATGKPMPIRSRR